MQKNNAFCSICTVNYAAYAGVLNDSLKKAGHNEPHYVLVVDYDEKHKEIIDKFNFTPIYLSDLVIPKIDELIEKYSAFELSNVLKPFFMEWLLKNHKNIENLVYLDTDIYVYAPFAEVFDHANKNRNTSVILTPHLGDYEAYSAVPGYKLEQRFLNYGLYNGGFYLLKNNRNALQFLNWHKKKLFNYGYDGPSVHMFADQKILDFAPLLFGYVEIYKNKTYNIAYWNYHERPIEYKDGAYFVGREKMVFFHFSQLRINTKSIEESTLCDLTLHKKPVLAKIVLDYWNRLRENSYENLIKIPYTYKAKYKKPPLSFTDPLLAKSMELDSAKEELKRKADSCKYEIQEATIRLQDLIKEEKEKNRQKEHKIRQKEHEIREKGLLVRKKEWEIKRINRELYDIRTSLRWKIPNYLYKKYIKLKNKLKIK